MKILTCAIQFGTSRIMAIAAWKNTETGMLENIEIESENTKGCITHGCVSNVEQTAMHIKSIMQKLGNRMRTTISAAYVGMGGISLHSLIQLPSVQIPGYDVLQAEPISGGQHQLIVGEKRLRQGVVAAMERAGIKLIDVIVLPQASARILTETERQRGCVLIDMGAGTTTVSIYKNGDLQHMAVIPLGGDAVTSDIQSNGCSEEEAERNKIEWSNASEDSAEVAAAAQQAAANAVFAEKALSMSQETLNTIVICRYEEIVANILHQINKTGLKNNLAAGVILTGGAAMQRGITSLISKRLDISRVETRAYAERAFVGSERKPHLTNLLAMLNFCNEDCMTPVAKTTVAEAPTTVKPVAPAPAAKPAVATPVADTTANKSQTSQLTLDIPQPDPEPEPEIQDPTMEEPKSSTLLRGLKHFLGDLVSGQN